jgi:CMP-N-acetylneuraminic acid synthetase
MQLGGVSLVQRAVNVAIESEQFDEVILSTDDGEIARSVLPHRNLIVDERPPSLAEDQATVLQAVLELIGRKQDQGAVFDTVTIMLPTCPFRKPEHIREGFRLLEEEVDAVISVSEYDFPWEMALDLNAGGDMSPAVEPSPLITGNTRSQDRRRVYHPNGAFYIGRWDIVERDGNFFKGRLRGVPMDPYHSADIDEAIDFKIAELLLSEGVV